jgi:hypothetical protein
MGNFKFKLKTILFVFSNKTHFETALPILYYLKDKYKFLAIFNFIDKEYSKGLENYFKKYRNLFEETFSITDDNFFTKNISNYLKVKKVLSNWIKNNNIITSFQFIEGGYIDWLVIGILKENNIKTIVLQWAITWEPRYYDMLRSKNIIFIKQVIKKMIKKLLKIDYPTMKYLGNGNADYLLTMGEFWTQQFLKYHNYPDKFITTGNPRFLKLTALKEFEKKHILFVTGAGSKLYNYDKKKHLKDIEDVYLAFERSNINKKLIHKIHPRDVYINDILKLSKNFPNVEVKTNGLMEDILKNIYLTIVIRSTVGFEALVAGSKLLVYNNSNQSIGFNYAKYNLAKEAKNIEELSTMLINSDQIDIPENIEYFIKTKNVLIDIKNVIENK